MRIRCIALVLAGLPLWANALEINTATEAELDSVKGLGPSQTARILQARANGPFTDWTDLMVRVRGIRPASASKLSAQGLTVQGAAFVHADRPAEPASSGKP